MFSGCSEFKITLHLDLCTQCLRKKLMCLATIQLIFGSQKADYLSLLTKEKSCYANKVVTISFYFLKAQVRDFMSCACILSVKVLFVEETKGRLWFLRSITNPRFFILELNFPYNLLRVKTALMSRRKPSNSS
jgi:hypothetical protein